MDKNLSFFCLLSVGACVCTGPFLMAEQWKIGKVERPSYLRTLFGGPATIVWLRAKFAPQEKIDPGVIEHREPEILSKAAEEFSNEDNPYQFSTGTLTQPLEFRIDYDDLRKQFKAQETEGVVRAWSAMNLASIIDELFYTDGLFFTDALLKELHAIVDVKHIAVRSSYLLQASDGTVRFYDGIKEAGSPRGLVEAADGVDAEGYLRFKNPVKAYLTKEMRKFNAAIGWKKTLERQLKDMRALLLQAGEKFGEEEVGQVGLRLYEMARDIMRAFTTSLAIYATASFDTAFASDYYCPDANTAFWVAPGAYNRFDANMYHELKGAWFFAGKKRLDAFKQIYELFFKAIGKVPSEEIKKE
jgi:hypothetical protein